MILQLRDEVYNLKKTAIVTDSNSGITQHEGKEMGIHVIPMPFSIDGEQYWEDINLSQEEFYQKLGEDANISTSQPSPGDVINLWETLLKEYDEIVHIPMSSGLSNAPQTALLLSREYDGRVQVVDNQRISVTQKTSVMDALNLIETGKSAAEIKKILEEEKLKASIYITVDTLKYLQRGGRVTPAGAALGAVLNIKPVLQIQGEKLDAYAKVRGWKSAKRTMLKAIAHDLDTRFADVKEDLYLGMAYTGDPAQAEIWREEIQEAFPGYEIIEGPLSLSVSCHIGAGALGVGIMKKVRI